MLRSSLDDIVFFSFFHFSLAEHLHFGIVASSIVLDMMSFKEIKKIRSRMMGGSKSRIEEQETQTWKKGVMV